MQIEQLSNAQLLISQQTQQGSVKIFENKLFRWLCFNNEEAIQSCMLRKHPATLSLPYQQFMMMWQLLSEQLPQRACLLGLGGGDMVRYLRETFPVMEILAVDSNPLIAQLASKFFHIQPDKSLTIEIAEAEDFITKPDQYDLLLIDIIVDRTLPVNFLTGDFWQHCQQRVNKQGVIVLNVILETEQHFIQLLEILRKEFGYLPFCMGVPDHKNIVLLMPLQECNRLTLGQLEQRSVELKQKSDLPYQQCVEILAKDNGLK